MLFSELFLVMFIVLGLSKPLEVLINELVGPWTLKYADGFEGHITVSTTGKKFVIIMILMNY